jgi:hypothetical protein
MERIDFGKSEEKHNGRDREVPRRSHGDERQIGLVFQSILENTSTRRPTSRSSTPVVRVPLGALSCYFSAFNVARVLHNGGRLRDKPRGQCVFANEVPRTGGVARCAMQIVSTNGARLFWKLYMNGCRWRFNTRLLESSQQSSMCRNHTGGRVVSKNVIKLKPSEQAILGAAATIYAGYTTAGRVPEGNENDWLRRSLKEAIRLALLTDDSIQADGEFD